MSSFAGLADYIRAVAHLGWLDEPSRAEIARLVGLDTSARAGAEDPERASEPPPDPVGAGVFTRPGLAGGEDTPLRGREIESELRLVSTTRPPIPEWLQQVAVLPIQDGGGALGRIGVPEPLLAPAQTRAILSTGLATTAYDGALWVEEAVRRIARGQHFGDVPRMPRPTLLRGVQVLVDRGGGMLPFYEDVKELLDRIRSVVGRTLVHVLQFEASPLRGVGAGAQWSWTGYEHHRPAPGTVVLLVTDLGIGTSPAGSGASVREWLAFAELVRRERCALRALVPYPENRWPAALKDVLTILPWDRGTGVHRVQRALAHERPRLHGEAP